MSKKAIALKLNMIVLGLAGSIDLVRGYMHTFNVRYAATQKAGIEALPDSLVLMTAFGISNFLTAFIYFLILRKAPRLAPNILLLIPLSYALGAIAMKHQHVTMESPFVGRYLMMVYLSICFLSSVLYFVIPVEKQRKVLLS